jgi:hypothetical protein
VPTMLRFQSGDLPTPADSTGGRGRVPNTAALAAAYSIFPTALGLQAAAQRKNWSTLLDPPNVPDTVPTLPPVESKNLESSRMALLRRGEWQLFFHYGQVHGSHAQSEALTFEAFYGNTDITRDAGTVGYGSPMHRDYYTRGLAHNVPLMDGEGQERWMPGELLRFDANAGVVAALQSSYRRGVSAERELRISGEQLIDVATISATDTTNSNRRAGLALHLQGKINLPANFQVDSTLTNARPRSFTYWKSPRSATFRDRASFTVRCGQRDMRVSISTPGTFTVTHAITPDMPPRHREALYIETTRPQATFTTVIEPIAN